MSDWDGIPYETLYKESQEHREKRKMTDLIDRKQAIKAITQLKFRNNFLPSTVVDALREQPTVEVEPVRHGYWIDLTATAPGGDTKPFKCSVCGRRAGYGQHRKYKFCPTCGAKMDEEAEDEAD